MRPIVQSGLTLLAVACGLAVFFGLRYAQVAGAFETITPVTPGACRVIAKGLVGPEDLNIDPAHDAIFVSAGGVTRNSPRDGLYRLKLSDPMAPPVRLAGTPGDFHPHGIDLYRAADGSESLMVVDHKANGGHAIEIYGVGYAGGTPRLTQQTFMRSRLLISPNDIAAISPNGFYVTNDHGAASAFGRFFEDYLFWPHSYLALSNTGIGLRIAVQRIAFANGVLVSPDGRFVYVTAYSDRRVIGFSREPYTGNLTEIGALSLPARPDNISMDSGGSLIIAGRTKPASAQVFRVRLGKDGVPQSYETLFSDDGRLITRASSAAVWDGYLFIGSSRDDHMLECDMK